jgi:outer membrane protein
MRLVASGLPCLVLASALLIRPQPCHAQTAAEPSGGLTAGTLLLRGRVVGIFPENVSSVTVIGGHINVSNSVTPEIDLSYFLTDHIALEGEAGITRNSLTAEDTAIGTVSVGKVWGAPIVAVVQYHLLPHARWNPYAGVGVSFLPYFDAQPAGGLSQQLSVRSEVGAVFQGGIDLQISDRWYGNLDIKKLIVSSYASVNDGEITATGQISPLIVGLGIGYRF